MQLALTSAFLLSLVSGIAAQCTGSDHPNCASWKKNGYCTNTGTSLEQRKLYCGVSCGLCNADGTQTAAGGGSVVPPCVDANANCASWQLQSPPFCANPSYSTAMKQQYCCKTCSVPVNPSTACAVLYVGTAQTEFLNTGPVLTLAAFGSLDPVTKVFVKRGCTLNLSDAPDMMPLSPVPGSPFAGTDAFVTVTPPAAAMAFSCTCP